jgi:formylglycine-generating enzyme required for sulfatase activity
MLTAAIGPREWAQFAVHPSGAEPLLRNVKTCKERVTLNAEKMIFRRISPRDYGKDLKDFFLFETEVSNGMYERFLKSTGRSKGDTELAASERAREELENRSHTYHTSSTSPSYDLENAALLWRENKPPRGKGNYPVALLTIEDAKGFCQWLSRRYRDAGTFRLPTHEEWLIAAYGGGKRNYPWGDTWDPRIPYVSGSKAKQRRSPIRVTSRTRDATPEGIRHLWGNVQEYIQNPWASADVFWMGPSFKTYTDTEGDPFRPKQEYWGYVHSGESREEGTGFRVLLEPETSTGRGGTEKPSQQVRPQTIQKS